MLMNINWFENRVSLTPNDIAVIDSKTETRWTYANLNERAEKIAAYLLDKGLKKGDRIVLLAPNHISYFDLFFASMKIGVIFVPLNHRLVWNELIKIVKDCTPKLIFSFSTFKNKFVSEGLESLHVTISDNIYIDNLRSDQTVECDSIEETDDLMMIYTGGTTGQPKGVVLSHRSILWNAVNTIVTWGVSREDITLTSLPMFHTGGFNVFSVPILLAGGKIVIMKEFEPEKAVKILIKYHCTTALFVPTMYHMMIKTEIFQQSNFPHLKEFVSGGAPCSYDIYKVMNEKGIPFREGYGLTEAGPNNFYINPKDALKKYGSVGKPMLFNNVRIVNKEGKDVDVGEVGDLHIKGNHSFGFYWNNEVETVKTLHNGWVHTGDLAKKDTDGYVYIVGRKNDMIITGGENVYPLEIEQLLEMHESVSEAAVVGIPDEKWGEKVVGFVVLIEDIQIEELREYCKEKLSSHKVPKHFLTMVTLPKTHVGKIDKIRLQEKYIEHLK